MYVAGTSAILLLWAGIVSLGYLSEYVIMALTPSSRSAARGSTPRCGEA